MYSKRQESKAQTDTDRLESIKKQILSKLGLTQKPKVFNKLPKQYIWDTLYRADGVNSVSEMNGFTPHTRTIGRILQGDNSMNHQSFNEQYYLNNKVSNYNHNYDTYMTNGAVSNSNYLTLLHLKNNTKIFSNYMQKEQYIKSIFKKEQLKDYPTVNKNTYLSNNNYINFSARSTKDVYQNTPEHIFFENEDFFGTTQEVITFAEAGTKYKKHRLIEFSAQIKNVPSQKSFIRNAMIHIRIGKHAGNVAKYVLNQKHKIRKSQSNAKLKVWIFQVITSNLTLKGFDEFARLRASFNVDTKRLGWQKFDLTQTVNDWYANNVSEKLKLLIDCTGCGREYELYLFDEVKAPENIQRSEQKQKQSEQQQIQNQNQNLNHNQNQNLNQNQQNFRYKKMNIFFHNKHKEKIKNKNFPDKNKAEGSLKGDYIKKNMKDGTEINQYVNNLDYSLPPTIGITKQNNDNCLEMNHCKYKNFNLFSGQDSLLSSPKLTQLNINNTETGASLKLQQDLNPNRPFLVLRTETKRLRRVRRRAVDCSGAMHGQCCKESFYVSFKALGWDDWIIAPRGYFANYCRGDCTGPFRTPDTFQTFHAHFIEEYRKMGLLNGMKPCCAPVKFSSMSLIYYGDDGIIKRDLPKMVIDECGCP
ncbi:inhibin beta chain [Teleopsis dalmanni]|uniref:inhibin beta chain n=1 Tax=Teleopsis dalmanni TaxID=139649 RepID=UPI0018CE30E6|nr:inhibin beta chain [Teleopsis dalmanni]